MTKANKLELEFKKAAEEFSELKKKIAQLEVQEDEMKAKLVASMKKMEADKIETNVGAFTIYPKTNYKYSPAVEEAKSKVKEMEKIEQQSGLAKAEVVETFRFSPIKIKE